jgi:hypothetical protein
MIVRIFERVRWRRAPNDRLAPRPGWNGQTALMAAAGGGCAEARAVAWIRRPGGDTMRLEFFGGTLPETIGSCHSTLPDCGISKRLVRCVWTYRDHC